MNKRVISFVLAAAIALPVGGCIPKHLGGINGVILLQVYVLMKILGVAKTAPHHTVKPTLSVDLKADVSGVPTGAYDITLGTYGHFIGTQKIVNQRFATVTAKDTPDLIATVAAMVKDALGGENVTITKATAKVSTHETPFGVKAAFSAKITFSGTVTSGPDAGGTFKNATMKAKGTY